MRVVVGKTKPQNAHNNAASASSNSSAANTTTSSNSQRIAAELVRNGSSRVKELKDTITTLVDENVHLSTVNNQCERALQTIYKNAICIVCLDVLHDPVLLLCPKQCLQNLCRGCFLKTDKRCPTCKEMVLTSISCGYTVSSVLGCVPRECDDCHCMVYPTDRHTTLQQCAMHRNVCVEAELECCNKQHGCGLKYKRNGRRKHLKEFCAHVPCSKFIGCFEGRCFGCKFTGSALVVDEHEKTCVLDLDTHFLFTQLIKRTTHDESQTPIATDLTTKCKNVEHIISLLRNEHNQHHVHY